MHENIYPVKDSGNLNLFESDMELFPGFQAKLFNGHTDGQVIPHISVNGKTLVFCADLFPSAAHLPMPYIMAYDIRPMDTLQEKSIFLEKAIENNHILFFEHDKDIECCTLKRTEKGIEFDKLIKLEDI